MEKLNEASKKLSKLNERDVRIISLPPLSVASYRIVGENPEEQAIEKFVLENNLIISHIGAFEEWEWLLEWVQNNDKYEYRVVIGIRKTCLGGWKKL